MSVRTLNARTYLLSAVTLTAVLFTTASAQKVELPPRIELLPGETEPVRLVTDCAKVRWESPSKELKVAVFRGGLRAEVSASVPGSYPLFAYGVKGGELSNLASATVVVGGGDPVPPPADEFLKGVQAIYDADADPRKAEYVRTLADVYEGGVIECAKDSNKFPRAVVEEMNKLADSVMTADGLKPLRKHLAEQNDKVLPRKSGDQFTAESRKKYADQFKLVSETLRKVKVK